MTHISGQGLELAVLDPIEGLGGIASNGTLGLLAENDKTSEIQVAEEKNESNNNNCEPQPG